MTNRSRLLAPTITITLLLSGCPTAIELTRDDAATVDGWRPTPMPATRVAPRDIEPWTQCTTALDDGAQLGDPCDWDEGSWCGRPGDPTVGCDRGRIVLGDFEASSNGVCEASVLFDGQCAEYELCSQAPSGGSPCRDRRYRFCQPEITFPTVEGLPTTFPDDVHYANREGELCAPLLAAELGQPCTGVGGCAVPAALGLESTSLYAMLVWCDGAYVHRVLAETGVDPLLGATWDPTEPTSRGGCD